MSYRPCPRLPVSSWTGIFAQGRVLSCWYRRGWLAQDCAGALVQHGEQMHLGAGRAAAPQRLAVHAVHPAGLRAPTAGPR
jgi:hypothetical protein